MLLACSHEDDLLWFLTKQAEFVERHPPDGVTPMPPAQQDAAHSSMAISLWILACGSRASAFSFQDGALMQSLRASYARELRDRYTSLKVGTTP